jgi:hypothetical protein
MSEWQVYPALVEWRDFAADRSTLKETASELRLVSGFDGFDLLPELGSLQALWCFGVDENKWEKVCSCKSLQRLFVEGIRLKSLRRVKDLTEIKVLSLENCSTITHLGDIGQCIDLMGLGIINFKNVHSLEPISSLVGLKQLVVAGGMWTRMKIDSLEPLSKMNFLEDLDIANTKVANESLRPLGDLTSLSTLNLPNFFPMEEFAWLSGRLPKAKCTWFSPFVPLPHNLCRKCGSSEMVMLSGKRKPSLCKRCDHARLQKHTEEFHGIASQSRIS